MANNLFGDILSDLGRPAPEWHRAFGQPRSDEEAPSLFEPVHGSAPGARGLGLANPIGQIWSGALMLDSSATRRARRDRLYGDRAVLDPSAGGPKTRDLGGNATTADLGRAIADAVRSA